MFCSPSISAALANLARPPRSSRDPLSDPTRRLSSVRADALPTPAAPAMHRGIQSTLPASLSFPPLAILAAAESL